MDCRVEPGNDVRDEVAAADPEMRYSGRRAFRAWARVPSSR